MGFLQHATVCKHLTRLLFFIKVWYLVVPVLSGGRDGFLVILVFVIRVWIPLKQRLMNFGAAKASSLQVVERVRPCVYSSYSAQHIIKGFGWAN
jgi:hypothetical protein